MRYRRASQHVKNQASKENYLLFEISYDKKLILPFSDGMAFINSLQTAEELYDEYSKPPRIQPLEKGKIRISTLSRTDYENIKISALLNISLDEVVRLEQIA